MVWGLTEDETKHDIRMNIGQGKRYWEARKQMELEKCLGSGHYGKLLYFYITVDLLNDK